MFDQASRRTRFSDWRAVLALVVVLLVASCTSTTATRQGGHVFRDCKDCPELVVVKLPLDAVAPEPGTRSVAIAVGRYEITVDEFRAFLTQTETPATATCFFPFGKYRIEDLESYTWEHPGGLGEYQPSGRDPAICVSWFEAQAYVTWLSQKTGQHYRLPSDAELKYLANGDATTRYPWGDRSADACTFANGLDEAAGAQDWMKSSAARSALLGCNDRRAYIAPVGSYKQNAFGLYDTVGNVNEWTSTCGTDLSGAQTDDGDCPGFFIRGGSWFDGVVGLSNDRRAPAPPPNTHLPTIGFRVIRVLSD